jgi:hypothetical protein
MKKQLQSRQQTEPLMDEAAAFSSSTLNPRPLLPPIASQKPSNHTSTSLPETLTNSSMVKQIHLNHFVLDNRPRTSPETLYVVGHNLNQAVQKEAREMCRLLGEVRRRQWTKESSGGIRVKEQSPVQAPVKKRCRVSQKISFSPSF